MSDIFAEATVTLVPDTKGFATRLQAQLKEIITAVETGPRAPKVRVAPALTRNFVGDLRKQVNEAVVRAQKGVKPIQVSAVLTNVSSAAIAREVQNQTRQVAAAGAAGAATRGAAFQTAAAGARQIAESFLGLASPTRVFNSELGRTATLLGSVTQETRKQTEERARGAASIRNVTNLLEQQTAAQIALARAQRSFAEAQLHAAGTSQQAAAFRRAERFRIEALAVAHGDLDQEVRKSAVALGDQLRASDEGRKALGEHSAAAARAARSHSQLRRGILATSLSFLGIRGATLAASASFLAGAAAIAIFAKALDNATRFTDQLNVFRATTSATVGELQEVREVARALGADLTLPGVTAADAAEAMTELAKAGLDVRNSIAGARGVLELATAAAIENAQATELVANALNAFGLAGEDATRVADTFANAANAAQGSIVDIGIAFQQAAAAGRQVGISFEDTTTFLTILQREGLRGSDAGTSLRTALIRLIRPTKDAAEEMAKLGIETRDAIGNLRPDIFIQIAQLTRDLSRAERDRIIALVGGQDAFRAISILGRQSIQDFIRLRRELREQGTAGELAAARMQGLRGSLEGLGNLLSTVGIRLGQGLTPPLQGIVDSLAGVTQGLSESRVVAQTLQGVLDAVTTSWQLQANALQAVAAVAVPVAGNLAQLANAFGITNILAAVAAYKLLPPLFLRIRATATVATVAVSLLALQGINPVRAAVTAALSSFNLWALGIAAVSAGLLFLITRETEAERATRRLATATDALVDAQLRLKQAQQERRTTGLSVSQAQLDVLNAREAVSGARSRLRASEPGSPDRIRAELELAVALDDVAAARDRLRQIEEDAVNARLVLANATRRENEARREAAASIKATADAARDAAFDVAGEGRRGETSAETRARANANAVAAFVQSLDNQIAKLRESDDAEALLQANRLERLKTITNLLGELPSEEAIDITINTPNAKAALEELISEFGVTGERAIAALRFVLSGRGSQQLQTGFRELITNARGLIGGLMGDLGVGLGKDVGDGVQKGVRDSGAGIAAALSETIADATRDASRGATRLTIAQGQGASDQTQLAIARQILADANRRLANARKLLGRGESPSRRDEFDEAADAQAAAFAQVEALEGSIAAAAKQAADDAKDAADKANQAILDRLERNRTRVENRLADARETETLADDLRFTIALRNLIRRQINRIRDLIKDRETQAAAIRALQQVELALGRDITSLQNQRRQQLADRAAERIQLNIEFAQLTENPAAEIRARLAEIRRLKRLQDLTKRGSIEYLRYRNLIEAQRDAIEELTKAQKDKNSAFKTMAFEFLTTQQGFAANLLGNLLPLGAVGGTVGGSIPSPSAGGPSLFPGGGGGAGGGHKAEFRDPSAGLEEASRISQARDQQGGFTAGQAATLIALTKQMVQLLGGIDTKGKHPEARRAQRAGGASNDVL